MSLELIKEIRIITGAGMSDVKKALDEAKGDKDQAIEILRKAGQKIAAKKSERQVKEGVIDKPAPYLYVVKEHNTKEHREKFFCKIKGSVCALNQGRVFLIVFMHSLRIDLLSAPQSVS